MAILLKNSKMKIYDYILSFVSKNKNFSYKYMIFLNGKYNYLKIKNPINEGIPCVIDTDKNKTQFFFINALYISNKKNIVYLHLTTMSNDQTVINYPKILFQNHSLKKGVLINVVKNKNGVSKTFIFDEYDNDTGILKLRKNAPIYLKDIEWRLKKFSIKKHLKEIKTSEIIRVDYKKISKQVSFYYC